MLGAVFGLPVYGNPGSKTQDSGDCRNHDLSTIDMCLCGVRRPY